MNVPAAVVAVLATYFTLNFLCALALHLHASRQAHLPVRTLDVAMHFVLLTLFAVPALLLVTLTAMFGGEGQEVQPKASNVAPLTRAA